MAQMILCPVCDVVYTAHLRGGSCPACGEELIHGRFPAGSRPRKKTAPHVSSSVWDHILKKDPCSICGESKSTTIDHIVPKALGGSKGSWTNRTGMCRPCNGAKAHTPLLFFLLEQQGAAPDWRWDEDGYWPIPDQIARQEAIAEYEEQTAHESANFNAQEFITAEKRAAKLLALKGQRME